MKNISILSNNGLSGSDKNVDTLLAIGVGMIQYSAFRKKIYE